MGHDVEAWQQLPRNTSRTVTPSEDRLVFPSSPFSHQHTSKVLHRTYDGAHGARLRPRSHSRSGWIRIHCRQTRGFESLSRRLDPILRRLCHFLSSCGGVRSGGGDKNPSSSGQNASGRSINSEM